MVDGAINVVAGAFPSRWKGSDRRDNKGEKEEKHHCVVCMERIFLEDNFDRK